MKILPLLCREFAKTHEARCGWHYFTTDVRIAVLTSWVAHRLRDHAKLNIEALLAIRDEMIPELLSKYALRVEDRDQVRS